MTSTIKSKRSKEQSVNLWNNEEQKAYREFLDAYLSLSQKPDKKTSLIPREVFIDELKQSHPKLALKILEDPCSNLRIDQHINSYNHQNILYQAGRGYGKTYAAAARVRALCDLGFTSMAMIGATYSDLVTVMIPCLISLFPEEHKPVFNAKNSTVYLPNGGKILTFTAEREVRGPSVQVLWLDEVVRFCGGNLQTKVYDFYKTLSLAFRGKSKTQYAKQQIITSTPKNWKIFRDMNKWCDDPNNLDWYKIEGSALDNPEMSEDTAKWIELYKGTPLEAQELYGKLVTSDSDLLWNEELLEKAFCDTLPPNLTNFTIALDPNVSESANSDEFGISVVAEAELMIGDKPVKIYYVLGDYSGKYSVSEWTNKVVSLSEQYSTRRVVAEKNQGGNMITDCLHSRDRALRVELIHASKSKFERAQPVSFLYHQGKVRHYHDKNSHTNLSAMKILENQLVSFDGSPTNKDDRLDAMVWALSSISNAKPKTRLVQPYRNLSAFPR